MTFLPMQLYRILLLLYVKHAVGQQDSETETEFLGSCPESCPWSSELINSTQVAGWCSYTDFPEPQIQLRLPKCKIITVKGSDFYIDQKNSKLVLHKNEYAIPYRDYQLADNNKTAKICYFLSPQLHNCDLKLLDRRLYAYDESLLALKNCKTMETIALGDFYELPGSRKVVSCSQSLGYNLGTISRCEFVILEPTEFQFLDNHTSIRLVWDNRIIYQALYRSKGSVKIEMCFPLSAEMTKCRRFLIYPHEYRLDAGHQIFVLSTRKHLNLGDYKTYPEHSNALHYCQDEIKLYTEADYVFYYCHIVQIISSALIMLTVVIHLSFPAINYHAKPLICQMVSLAVWFVAAPCRFLWYPDTASDCYILFAFLYFSALSSFLWLNVLAFDLYSIFANLPTSSIRLCAKMCDKKPKFLFYCVYAYCIPLVVTILSLVLEKHTSMQEAVGLYPDIIAHCWFWEAKSLYLFYSGPIFFLICVNSVLFGLTVCNLRKASEGVGMVNKQRNRQLLFVCIKVFVITGLCWIIEFITVLADGRGAASYPAIIATSIQGILLFIIYICKPSTIRILRRKVAGTITSKKPTDPISPKGTAHLNTSTTDISMESGISSENSTKEEIPGSKTLEQDKQQTTAI